MDEPTPATRIHSERWTDFPPWYAPKLGDVKGHSDCQIVFVHKICRWKDHYSHQGYRGCGALFHGWRFQGKSPVPQHTETIEGVDRTWGTCPRCAARLKHEDQARRQTSADTEREAIQQVELEPPARTDE